MDERQAYWAKRLQEASDALTELARTLATRLAPHLDDERKALLAEVGR
jgi:hypothetical protein